ncbi:OmpA family protein [Piscinibacter sakaiensis]|uniref:OmpA family protein n=1 Tax=Piscinibacter sakaiensis TaxID=1547922 RepID=UPI003AAAEF6B
MTDVASPSHRCPTPVARPLKPAAMWLVVLALFAALLAGCAAPPPQAVAISEELPFDQAIDKATEALLAQTQKLPGVLATLDSKLNKRGVVLDPMIDAGSGQQTAATQVFERRVVAQIESRHPQFEVLPFKAANLSRSQYLLTGTMTRQPAAQKRSVFLLNLALTDLKTGNVVAQASARARDQGVDTTPLPYYQDSPILLKDKVIDGYVRTTATAPGQPADRSYFERISTATLVNDATEAYNAGRYQDALGQYRAALATPAGEQLRVLNGIYLASWKLGRNAEAEQAFGKVVALGIAHNQLGVKFLFNPNSTEFWSDSRISGAYGMWLRQIAREAVNAKVCMDVVGHTSNSGPEELNDALSLRRASHVRQLLASEAPSLAPRMTPLGKGFRENIVGTGTDNAADALDRRVEFKIRPC